MRLRWRKDFELDEEIQAHIDCEIQANLDRLRPLQLGSILAPIKQGPKRGRSSELS